MIRVVFEYTPSIFGLVYLDEAELTPVITYGGRSYYRAETHQHYVKYRSALSGWGAAPNADDPRPVFDPQQR
ncbi:MAG TPA: hypothetical protein VKH35_13580 [Thermoanaerobaculia bacterium]|nr:hypothetical protein [Thermoanaerobaculia bacterium]